MRFEGIFEILAVFICISLAWSLISKHIAKKFMERLDSNEDQIDAQLGGASMKVEGTNENGLLVEKGAAVPGRSDGDSIIRILLMLE